MKKTWDELLPGDVLLNWKSPNGGRSMTAVNVGEDIAYSNDIATFELPLMIVSSKSQSTHLVRIKVLTPVGMMLAIFDKIYVFEIMA